MTEGIAKRLLRKTGILSTRIIDQETTPVCRFTEELAAHTHQAAARLVDRGTVPLHTAQEVAEHELGHRHQDAPFAPGQISIQLVEDRYTLGPLTRWQRRVVATYDTVTPRSDAQAHRIARPLGHRMGDQDRRTFNRTRNRS